MVKDGAALSIFSSITIMKLHYLLALVAWRAVTPVVSNRTVSQLLLASISPTPQFGSRNMSQRAPIYRY